MNEDSDGEVAIEIEDREVNLSLVDAIERLLKVSPGQWEHDQFEGKKTLSKSLSVPNLKMGDFLVELEDHPDLRDKSPSGKRATIRRAIAKSGNISKVGERKASSYVMIPIDHIQDITLESKKSAIINHMMRRGGTISYSDLQEILHTSARVQTTIRKTSTGRVVTAGTSDGQLTSALTILENEGLIQERPNRTYVCTPEVWGYSPSLKKSSTFTLSRTADDLLVDAVEILSGTSVDIPGFAMATPEAMSKSGFVEIAISHTYNTLISRN